MTFPRWIWTLTLLPGLLLAAGCGRDYEDVPEKVLTDEELREKGFFRDRQEEEQSLRDDARTSRRGR